MEKLFFSKCIPKICLSCQPYPLEVIVKHAVWFDLSLSRQVVHLPCGRHGCCMDMNVSFVVEHSPGTPPPLCIFLHSNAGIPFLFGLTVPQAPVLLESRCWKSVGLLYQLYTSVFDLLKKFEISNKCRSTSWLCPTCCWFFTKIYSFISMFEAWNVAKGRKVQGGRILSQGTVLSFVCVLIL